MDTQWILFWWARNMVSQMTAWQEEAKRKHDEQLAKNSETEWQNLYLAWLNATDPKAQQQNFTGANAINVWKIIAQAAKDHWSNSYDWLEPNQAISRYMEKNPDKMDITNKAIAWEIDLNTWANAIWAYIDDTDYTEWWLYESYAPVDTSWDGKAIAWTVWLWVLWVWWSLFWASELLDRWLNLYWWSFDMNEDEARNIQRDNANRIELKKYNDAIKKQEKVLEKAVKDNVGVEEAQAKLDYLKSSRDRIENSLNTTTRKTIDTATDYSLQWWNKAQIWDKAKAAWEYMFNTEIIPALQNSKQTVNIQELINNINVEELAKWDPDKLAAYADALEDLKASFSDPKYAEYSMMDTQTLKSGLQGRTPQKFYKWKEITNELQELKWILGSEIKSELHNKLSAEMWADTAKKYLDYANLMDIAKQWVKDRAASKSKGGFWAFQNFVKDKLVTPVSSKVWLRARQLRQFFENIPSKISEEWKKILQDIKSNPKWVLKKWWKGIKELLKMDAMMFAPDYREMADNAKYEVSLSLIQDRLNWKWIFKWKSEEEIEELVPMQSIMDTLQNEEFIQYLYNQWIDIEELEKQLTNISE